MCLPMPLLRFIVVIGASVSIVISFGLLAITIYANLEKKSVIDQISQGIVNDALILLYVSSIIFMLLGIAGLYGSIKGIKKKPTFQGRCLLGFFTIGIFVFFIFFLLGTIFFFIGSELIFGNDCKSGSKTTLIQNIYNTTMQADSQFCTKDCPCYIEDQNSTLARKLIAAQKVISNDKNDKTRYQDCAGYNNTNEKYVLILAGFEEAFKCGGWCPNDISYYRFTNIGNCVNDDCLSAMGNCHEEFQSFFRAKGNLVGVACLISMLVCLVNIVTVCCICFHPTKRGSSKNFYARMLQVQQNSQ